MSLCGILIAVLSMPPSDHPTTRLLLATSGNSAIFKQLFGAWLGRSSMAGGGVPAQAFSVLKANRTKNTHTADGQTNGAGSVSCVLRNWCSLLMCRSRS